MKIISWNVNGIRACVKKGYLEYLSSAKPDVLCIQETKAHANILDEQILHPPGYTSYWCSAEKKGYSGVANYIKNNKKPKNVQYGFGISRFDNEGRVLTTEFDNFILFNVYFPNGQKDDTRLKYKLDFYKALFNHIGALKQKRKNIIICGDYNTAHTEIDLANPKQNENYSGFLPVERAWIDKIITDGYVDTFRAFNQQPNQYSWWTYRFGARERNIGWRIDYFFVNKSFMKRVVSSKIEASVLGSDHCPIVLTVK